jgi:hypothetical protein
MRKRICRVCVIKKAEVIDKKTDLAYELKEIETVQTHQG